MIFVFLNCRKKWAVPFSCLYIVYLLSNIKFKTVIGTISGAVMETVFTIVGYVMAIMIVEMVQMKKDVQVRCYYYIYLIQIIYQYFK